MTDMRSFGVSPMFIVRSVTSFKICPNVNPFC